MAIATTIVISKGVDVGNQRQDGEETGSRLAWRTLKFNHHYPFSYLEGAAFLSFTSLWSRLFPLVMRSLRLTVAVAHNLMAELLSFVL